MVAAVEHVLLARPDQLDRRARHLLRDRHRLAHEIVARRAPAEAAAEIEPVDVALADRQAGGIGRRRKRRLGVLRRRPDLAFRVRPERRRVHRLHGGVVLIREGVDRLVRLRGAGDGGLDVAALVADEGLLRGEALLQHRGDVGARELRVRPLVPVDGEGFEGVLRAPPGIGDDGDAGVADLHDALDAGHAGDLRRIEALQLAAEDRTIPDRRVQHARKGHVHAVDLLAVQLVESVEPLHRLAGDGPVLRVLERDLLRHRHRRGERRDLAVGRGAAGRAVRHDAFGGAAILLVDAPFLGGRGDQHRAGGCAPAADVILRIADAAAAGGLVIAPDAVALQVLAGRRIFRRHLRPVAFELLGHELGEAGEGALSHLDAGDADHHGVVRLDHDPGVDLGRRFRGGGGARSERDVEAEGKAAHGGRRAGEEAATGNGVHRHRCLPVSRFRRRASPPP